MPPPAKPEPPVGSAEETFPYVIMVGDTFEEIAQKFGVLRSDILKMNNLPENATPEAGKTIQIPPLSF